MRGRMATGDWSTLSSRVGWQCTPAGFAHASVLSGGRAFAAVGAVDAPLAGRSDSPVRAGIDEVLRDVALTEGYDARAVLDLATAALALEGLGTVASVALFTGDDGASGLAAPGLHVAAWGTPMPVAVRPDGRTIPVGDGYAVAPGWVVVLTDSGTPLPPAEARALVEDHADVRPGGRTALAVHVGY